MVYKVRDRPFISEYQGVEWHEISKPSTMGHWEVFRALKWGYEIFRAYKWHHEFFWTKLFWGSKKSTLPPGARLKLRVPEKIC